MKFKDRLSHAWNAFLTDNRKTEQEVGYGNYGYSSSLRPDRARLRTSSERSIISSIYTRLGIDVASVDIRHTKRDADGRYLDTVNSGLHQCLNVSANLDQGARAFRQDLAMTLYDEGVVAVVPVSTSIDPRYSGGYDIKSLRVGKITAWYPKHVKVSLYNEDKGTREEVTLSKHVVAIIENPLYSVMNEPNSILQRLIRKLSLLDAVDEATSSGKLDVIIQLPYVVKTETRRKQAEERRADIEMQLRGSKYGIAYTDGTERITQLNRPAENNMLSQIKYLTSMLYGQLGLTEAIFDGTADEAQTINYYNRTIEPILASITEELNRKFLTKTARSQHQKIDYIRDPFKLVPISQLAEIADKFTRNEILSSNEVRGVIGIRPANDPNADKLINKNIPAPKEDNSDSKPSLTEERPTGTDE